MVPIQLSFLPALASIGFARLIAGCHRLYVVDIYSDSYIYTLVAQESP